MRRFAGKVVQGVRRSTASSRRCSASPGRNASAAAPPRVAEVVAEAAQAAGLPACAVRLQRPRELRADADALVRVLTNLFRNAIEAAPAVPVDVTCARAAAGSN
jgi:signal transduction histidine kinase